MATRFNDTQLAAVRVLIRDLIRMADTLELKLVDRSIEDAISPASKISDKAHQLHGLIQDFTTGGGGQEAPNRFTAHKFVQNDKAHHSICLKCGQFPHHPFHIQGH